MHFLSKRYESKDLATLEKDRSRICNSWMLFCLLVVGFLYTLGDEIDGEKLWFLFSIIGVVVFGVEHYTVSLVIALKKELREVKEQLAQLQKAEGETS